MAERRSDQTDPLVLGPVSDQTADLLRRFPIAKPASSARQLEVRDGRVVEVVSEAAFVAIKTYLDGGDVELTDTELPES